MVMQDKRQTVKKLSNYCLFMLIVGYMILTMLNVPTLLIKIVMATSSCGLYLTILMQYKLDYDKIHKKLLLLGIICMAAQLFSTTLHNRYVSIISMIFVYIFYNYNYKLRQNKWNKSLILFGVLVTTCSVLSIYFNNKWINFAFVIIDLLIYGKFLNRIMNDIGMKRKKQLEEQGFTEEDAKKVPLIRKILFGKTGKLDLSIVEMITGKDLSKFKKNET